MALRHLTPKGLFKPANWTQVVIATGRRVIFVAGQVAVDADGKLVAPGDLAGQAKQVYANLRTALAGVGAGPADVTKLTTYVVGYRPEFRPILGEARASVFGTAEPPASTLVGVQALADPGYLVEIEAIALID